MNTSTAEYRPGSDNNWVVYSKSQQDDEVWIADVPSETVAQFLVYAMNNPDFVLEHVNRVETNNMIISHPPVQVWHGSNKAFSINDINCSEQRMHGEDRKISMGAYFTNNEKLAACYGKPMACHLAFNKLLDLRRFEVGTFTPKEFFDALPVNISLRIRAEITAGYVGAQEPYFLLESLLRMMDLVSKLKSMGYDGITFNEAYSDTYVAFDNSVVLVGI